MNLLFSTRPLSGKFVHSLVEQFKLVESVGECDILLMNKTTSLVEYVNVVAHTAFNPVEHYFNWYHEHGIKCRNWEDVYERLDVTPLQKYENIFMFGGLLSESAKLKRGSKRAAKFPVNDHAQIKFISTGVILTHVLALLKAHREYNIPLHEIIYDTQEVGLGGIHPDWRPNNNYFLYHGYDIPRYHCRRLDTLQWFYANANITRENIAKDIDFTVGYTIITRDRSNAAGYVSDIANKFANTKLFVHDKLSGTSNFVSRPEYLNWIARSKYTAVIPPYDTSSISIFRIIESLQHDCIPLIHPQCQVTELEQSFNTNLSNIVCTPDWQPFTDTEYSTVLEHLKLVFLQFEHGFVKCY